MTESIKFALNLPTQYWVADRDSKSHGLATDDSPRAHINSARVPQCPLLLAPSVGAFTAPAIIEVICQGRQPAELSAEALLRRIDLRLERPLQLKAVGLD
jgi:hypothetical protein